MRLLPLLLLLACAGSDGKPGLFESKDQDGDGYRYDEDCNDDDAEIHPGANEVCDPGDTDEDCNGKADSDDGGLTDGIPVYTDADGDGYGDEAGTACETTPGFSAFHGDCDDANPNVNPAAHEICDSESVDEDCNGIADDDDPDHGTAGEIPVWADSDGDTYGDADAPGQRCHTSARWSGDDDDCDDQAADVHPGADERCDDRDEDCDGETDNAAIDRQTWYEDQDGDGYGDLRSPITACDRPTGAVSDETDCDDRRAESSPGSPETCNGLDDDCDGATDEADAVDPPRWYADLDGDRYGDERSYTRSCDAPAGAIADGTDCDDTDPAISPGADEVCDPADVDEDCSGAADDRDRNADTRTMGYWHFDDDGDGYGDGTSVILACDSVPGIVADDTDCDDADAPTHPGGVEVCDAADADEDCDGAADDEDPTVAPTSLTDWYPDADGDGDGASTGAAAWCDAPDGFTASNTDCDDTDPLRNPSEVEVCDDADRDEDCDALADDADPSVRASTQSSWYTDADADGYGAEGAPTTGCEPPADAPSSGTDCDDADAGVNPGASEACFDTVDADCDGSIACELLTSDADVVLSGTGEYGQWAGGTVANAGDQNGDGIDDPLVGAYGTPSAFFLVYGGGGDVDLNAADARLTTTSSGQGYPPVARLGDLDGDGVDDLALGDLGNRRAAVVPGPLTTLDVADTAVGFTGVTPWAMAAGDLDGDGSRDLLIGDYLTTNGTVYLATDLSVSAATPSLLQLTGRAYYDQFGTALATGDVDGDGVDDALIGAPTADNSDLGAAYLFSGPITASVGVSAATATVVGALYQDYAGQTVGIGDLDGDGYDDLVVGVTHPYDPSSVYVYPGPVAGSQALSAASGSVALDHRTGYGVTIASDGDMDGDGRDDLALGRRDDAGSVVVMLGPVSGALDETDAAAAIRGVGSSEYAGTSLAFVGAQDGTPGASDLLVGAPGYRPNVYTTAGAAFLFTGPR